MLASRILPRFLHWPAPLAECAQLYARHTPPPEGPGSYWPRRRVRRRAVGVVGVVAGSVGSVEN